MGTSDFAGRNSGFAGRNFKTCVHFVMVYLHLLVNVTESKNNANIKY